MNRLIPTNEGSSISELQSAIREISYLDRDIKRISVDGIYGAETAEAVRLLQRKYSLSRTDGKADLETFRRIISEGKRAGTLSSRSGGIFPFETALKDGRLTLGDRCETVAIVRLMLMSMATTYPFLEGIEVSYLFDTAVADAIAELQLIYGLDPSGELDRPTWDLLATSYNRSLGAG